MNDGLVSLLSQPMWVFLAVLARVSPPLMMAPPSRRPLSRCAFVPE